MEREYWDKEITVKIKLSTIIGGALVIGRAEVIKNAIEGLQPLLEDVEAIRTEVDISVSETKKRIEPY